MFDLFLLVLGNLICFWAGARWGHHRALLKIIQALSKNPRLLDRAISDYQRELAEITEPQNQNQAVTVEQIGTEYYVFTEDSNEFLAQAKTRDQALMLARERNPRITVAD